MLLQVSYKQKRDKCRVGTHEPRASGRTHMCTAATAAAAVVGHTCIQQQQQQQEGVCVSSNNGSSTRSSHVAAVVTAAAASAVGVGGHMYTRWERWQGMHPCGCSCSSNNTSYRGGRGHVQEWKQGQGMKYARRQQLQQEGMCKGVGARAGHK